MLVCVGKIQRSEARFVQVRDNQSGFQDFKEKSNIPDQH